MVNVREANETREDSFLSPYAQRAMHSQGRARPEEADPVRTVFQVDRDRILHSKPFRRLKHKTQVFIEPEGDHFRTRLTHTLEVSQIARTIGRALRLNEDLIEAIALGHDVGHPPFGHAGEAALDETLRTMREDHPELALPEGFRHDLQSLRVVEVLLDLNLTRETLSGIGGHSKGRADLSAEDAAAQASLEASVVRISDRIAYLNADIDDALRSGMIDRLPSEFDGLGKSHGKRIAAMVSDVITQSWNQPHIRLTDAMLEQMNALKEWMFENVYIRYPQVYPDIKKAKRLVSHLLRHYLLKPQDLPAGYAGATGAIDYVSGMTDRFAMATFRRMVMPDAFGNQVERVP